MIVVGVDPGLSGAMAWLRLDAPTNTAELLHVDDMPTAKARQGKSEKSHIVLPELARLLSQGNALYPIDAVVIEDVHAMPGQGVTSMFRFGYAAGAVAGVAAGIGLSTHFVRPQHWQAVSRMKRGDDAGRLRAAYLFPSRSNLFARKMDHNRADAALIGYAHLCEVNGSVSLFTR